MLVVLCVSVFVGLAIREGLMYHNFYKNNARNDITDNINDEEESNAHKIIDKSDASITGVKDIINEYGQTPQPDSNLPIRIISSSNHTSLITNTNNTFKPKSISTVSPPKSSTVINIPEKNQPNYSYPVECDDYSESCNDVSMTPVYKGIPKRNEQFNSIADIKYYNDTNIPITSSIIRGDNFNDTNHNDYCQKDNEGDTVRLEAPPDAPVHIREILKKLRHQQPKPVVNGTFTPKIPFQAKSYLQKDVDLSNKPKPMSETGTSIPQSLSMHTSQQDRVINSSSHNIHIHKSRPSMHISL
jgi:hypothetical protein